MENKAPLGWGKILLINLHFTGINSMTQATGLIAPLLVTGFVGVSAQGSAYGEMRLWQLMAALLLQSVMGLLSDRSTLHWGRRRPYIFFGSLLAVVLAAGYALLSGARGTEGYWLLFLIILLITAGLNTSLAAQQGLIPDLAPATQHGLASGVKALLELPVPLILTAALITPLIGQGEWRGALLVTAAILLLTTLLTMLVKENPLSRVTSPFPWQRLLRLVAMTALFATIILALGAGVKLAVKSATAFTDPAQQAIFLGASGLLAMLAAIFLGVQACLRVSLGRLSAQAHPGFRWWVVNRLAFLAALNSLSAFALYMLQVKLGLSGEQAAARVTGLMLVLGALVLLATIPGGWLSDRLGRKPLIALSAALAAAGVLVILLTGELGVIYFGGGMIGAGAGLFFATNWALGTDLAPPSRAAEFLGVSNLAGAGAGAIGAYIGGPIADSFASSQLELGYSVLLAIFGALFVSSALVLPLIHQPKSETTP